MVGCKNGYAHVILIPDPPESADWLPVFLRSIDGRWSIIAYGPELQCRRFSDLASDVVVACHQLGES
jgi:hypothetical protein